jgi:hypothetical protein
VSFGPSGNLYTLFAEAGVALQSVDHLDTYFTVQHRHPDGHRWVDLAHFASREDAEAAMRLAVSDGHADASELRVQRVMRETT